MTIVSVLQAVATGTMAGERCHIVNVNVINAFARRRQMFCIICIKFSDDANVFN